MVAQFNYCMSTDAFGSAFTWLPVSRALALTLIAKTLLVTIVTRVAADIHFLTALSVTTAGGVDSVLVPTGHVCVFFQQRLVVCGTIPTATRNGGPSASKVSKKMLPFYVFIILCSNINMSYFIVHTKLFFRILNSLFAQYIGSGIWQCLSTQKIVLSFNNLPYTFVILTKEQLHLAMENCSSVA